MDPPTGYSYHRWVIKNSFQVCLYDYIPDPLFLGRAAFLLYLVALFSKMDLIWTFVAMAFNGAGIAYDLLFFVLVRNSLVEKEGVSVALGSCSSIHSTFNPFGTNSVILSFASYRLRPVLPRLSRPWSLCSTRSLRIMMI